MKRIILYPLCSLTLIMVSCAKKSPFTNFEWTDKSGVSISEKLLTNNFKVKTSLNTKFDQVEFSEQKISDTPIEGAYLKKLYSSNGKLTYAFGSILENSKKVDTKNVLALKAKSSHIILDLQTKYPYLKKFNFEKPNLVLVSDKNAELTPEWRIVYFDSKGLAWKMKLNTDLSILSVDRVGSQFHEALAIVYPMGPRMSQLQDVIIKNLIGDGTLTSPNFKVTTMSGAKISNINDTVKFPPPDERFDQVQVFYTVNKALSWFETKLGITIPNILDIQVHVGAPEKTNTAFYYNGKIRLGAGDDITYSKIPTDVTMVTHETCHALNEAVAHLPYEGEGGSLNEGFADFFTASQLDHANMGDVAYLKGPYKRTLNNDFTLSSKNGGLYHDSLIVSGTLWDIRKQFGIDKAVEVGLKTLNRLGPNSDFTDFGAKLIITIESSFSDKELTSAKELLKKRGWI